jgi:molybdate transport system permease protein
MANLAEWGGGVRFFTAAMWISLPLYFAAAAFSVAAAGPGWAGRIFRAGTFLFVAAFTTFALVLILADAFYVNRAAVAKVAASPYVGDALRLSVVTSTASTALALLFAIPMGYALSRFSFPGRVLADALVDLPLVFPPLVVGLTFLVFFFQTSTGRWLQDDLGLKFAFEPAGIVLCQFALSASYAIRTAKVAFDAVDRRLENVALTLGCNPWSGFLRVTLPLAKGGILAGGVVAWARSFGIFGPLMIFVGSYRGRTEVLSTTIFLEQSVGELEVALSVAVLMILVALAALVTIRLVSGRALVRR